MARERDSDTEQTKETAEQEGVARRVVGRVRRVVDAIGRAARGAAGLSEAGTDVLFQKLHADHEEVNLLFEKLRREGEGPRAEELWREVSLKLTLHARAEQQTIYDPLSRWEETREQIRRAFGEHAEIERRLMQLHQLKPGSEPFKGELLALEQTVRHHVDDEEGQLLPRARKALSDQQLEMLVTRFEARKLDLMPMIEDELSRPPQRREREPEMEATERVPRVEPPRAAQKKERDSKTRETRSRRQRPAPKAPARISKKGGPLQERTYDELMAIARQREIPGRSKMNKEELVRALEEQPTDPG